ncbi:polymorphic toxin-type HINT domain-containing protein [Streptomyces canus]|uniref:polymorphic toxin-type HINT domain-containing protein n=1 Tax=Streptomyces canus TaxID=58343 RepID=UPI0033B2ED3F
MDVPNCRTCAPTSWSLDKGRPVGYVQDDVDWARSHGQGSRIMAKEGLTRLRNANIAYRESLCRSRQNAYDIAMEGDLTARQWLQTSAGTWAQITALDHRAQPAPVYNLTVDDLHTYYVAAGSRDLLVHNSTCLLGTSLDIRHHIAKQPGAFDASYPLHVTVRLSATAGPLGQARAQLSGRGGWRLTLRPRFRRSGRCY